MTMIITRARRGKLSYLHPPKPIKLFLGNPLHPLYPMNTDQPSVCKMFEHPLTEIAPRIKYLRIIEIYHLKSDDKLIDDS